MAAVLMALPIAVSAQTENPRGIYKMTSFTNEAGINRNLLDQYKICTDSITLMLNVYGSEFVIANTDHMVFNYTGEQPDDRNAKASRIYDSDANHFTLKWWSEGGGWLIEKYMANQYTENARMALDGLTAVSKADRANPLFATWRVIGWMDELKGVKKQLAAMKAQYATSKNVGQYVTITPNVFVTTTLNKRTDQDRQATGDVRRVQFPNKNTLMLPKEKCSVKWLSKDVIALEVYNDFRTDYQILERVSDGQSVMSLIASRYLVIRKGVNDVVTR